MKNIATTPVEIRPRSARMGRLHAAVAKAVTELLDELASFDEDRVWRTDGATDAVSWLTFELGLLPRTARDWLEVARALPELQELRRRLESGELSFDQIRPLVRIATAENEAELADLAENMTATEIARMVRKAQEIPKEDVVAQEPERVLTWWWQQDDRFLHLKGKLPAAEGALIEKALLRIAVKDRDADTEHCHRPTAERAADALAAIASQSLAADSDSDRATVVVHVSAEALASARGVAVVEHGPVIAVEAARRMACDSRWQIVVDGPDGAPIGIGRTSRRIPPWLSRMVRERDAGCRFRGCGRTRWTHAHHIEHWANGGPTDLDNLITLCGYHHRLIHDEGWSIDGDPNGDVVFVTSAGMPVYPARVLPAKLALEAYHLDRIERGYQARIAAAAADRGS